MSRLSDVPGTASDTQPIEALPSAMAASDDMLDANAEKRLVVCLDYDGTLTPIVDLPALTLLSDQMRRTLDSLAEVATVAIISGRDLKDLRRLVALDRLHYAGSHGSEIGGPWLTIVVSTKSSRSSAKADRVLALSNS